MYKIRCTKTSSNATAVQVVWYKNRKVQIAAHIGSAHNEIELSDLKKQAREWILKNSDIGQIPLFPKAEFNQTPPLPLERCQLLGVGYSFAYDCLTQLFDRFDFLKINNQMLLDLALVRIIEPASKLRSFKLLEKLFGIKYSYRNLNRHLPDLIEQKDKIEGMVLEIAKAEFGFDFSLVFYDVTTLYFESFGEDELRKPGFSKDGKSAQPQILIGLIVNQDGFPVAYEVFEGNTFEGKTIIPVIKSFQKRHDIKNLTVVADAGMISMDNIVKLKESHLNYIVGARIANLSSKEIKTISTSLNQRDGKCIKIDTKNGTLVCDFSLVRYKKDKREMEKQIAKANATISKPGKVKRAKFIKNKGKAEFEINDNLIAKTESLLGVKGYYTDLENLESRTIIEQYHNLWHVEHSFRIAKNDLEARPIYHFKKKTVLSHILICFMALAVCKYIELKTKTSIKRTVQKLLSVVDAKILDTITGEITTMKSPIPENVQEIVDKLNLKTDVILKS